MAEGEPERRDKKHRHKHRSRHHRDGRSDAASASFPAAAGRGRESTLVMKDDEEDMENWEENRKTVDRLCQAPPNNVCSDCNNTGTRWASVNHGVFLCIRCSGIHRSLGVHVSKVKSANMDKWTAAEVHLMELIGNHRGKLLYEARLPKDIRRMTAAESDDTLRVFIRQKYEERAFAVDGITEKLRQYHKEARYGKKPKRTNSVNSKKLENEDGKVMVKSRFKGEEAVKALYGSNADAIAKKSKKVDTDRGPFGVVNVAPDFYEKRRKILLEQFGFA